MSNIRIVDVSQCRFVLPYIAKMHYAEWGHLSPEYTMKMFEKWGNKIADNGEKNIGIERMFVAVEDANVLGNVCLLEWDLPERKDLTPWFASMYVFPNHRGRGVGTMLARRLIAHCRKKKLMPLYLVTELPWLVKWYEGMGFRTFETGVQYGHAVTFMRLDK